jgi:hypothetical protein
VDRQSDPVSDETERWFVHRGVPHFIDHYAATTDIWTRSAPLLAIAYVAGGFNALDLYEWSLAKNLAMSALVLGVLAASWAITNLVRRRSLTSRPEAIGTPELTAFVLGPALPSAIVSQWTDVVKSIVEGIAVLLVIYVTTSYAVIPLIGWAVRRSLAQVSAIIGLVARALPLLLLFTALIFLAPEIWQVMGTSVGLAYAFTLSIFFLLGALFVLSRIPGITRGLSTFESWSDVRGLLAETPCADLDVPADGAPPPYPLSPRQRFNAGLVAVFSQALQITLVSVLLSAFYVLFGLLAISEQTTVSWTTVTDVHVLLTLQLDGRTLVITEPLLRVAGFLGAFTGMYFTVVLATDATYREEFAEDVEPQIRQSLAVRAAYLWHRSRGETVATHG